MKNGLRFVLSVAVLVGISASVYARGGGHGGGHHGGGHHGGGHHAGGHHGGHHGTHHAGHHHTHHNNHHHTHFHHNNQPFTHGWYANHSGAWGNNGWGYANGYGNWWNGAGWGATAGWLGMAAATSPMAYSYPAGASTVYTADTSSGQAAQTAQNGSGAAVGQTANNNLAEATKLAQSGATDPAKGEKFLPLGVFSMAPQDQKEATAMLQIAVNKDGIVRGSYYDLVSDKEQPIQGAIDKKTQRVAFTAGTSSKVVFETGLASLTQESGPVSLYFENGAARPWTLARFEEDKPEDTSKVE